MTTDEQEQAYAEITANESSRAEDAAFSLSFTPIGWLAIPWLAFLAIRPILLRIISKLRRR